MTQRNEMMTAEATRYNTSVENLREQGFFFDENAFGDCHWFASCGELGGTPMSLAWYRAQQAGVRARLHAMRDKNAVMRSKRTFNISGGRSITAKVEVQDNGKLRFYERFAWIEDGREIYKILEAEGRNVELFLGYRGYWMIRELLAF